jgi:hypothetical protein
MKSTLAEDFDRAPGSIQPVIYLNEKANASSGLCAFSQLSLEAKLQTNANTDSTSILTKQPGDISTVEKMGTFLMRYDNFLRMCLTAGHFALYSLESTPA